MCMSFHVSCRFHSGKGMMEECWKKYMCFILSTYAKTKTLKGKEENMKPTTIQCSWFSMKNNSDAPSCMWTDLVNLALSDFHNARCMIICWVLLWKKASYWCHIIADIYNHITLQIVSTKNASYCTFLRWCLQGLAEYRHCGIAMWQCG